MNAYADLIECARKGQGSPTLRCVILGPLPADMVLQKIADALESQAARIMRLEAEIRTYRQIAKADANALATRAMTEQVVATAIAQTERDLRQRRERASFICRLGAWLRVNRKGD